MNVQPNSSKINELSDEHLVELFQSGYELAFNELRDRFKTLIKHKTTNVSVPGLESDDLTQEATLALMDSALTYDKNRNASFRTYASVCITRRIISAYKTASRMKHTPLNEFLPLDGVMSEFLADENPLSIIINREETKMFWEDVNNNLSEFELAVLFLRIKGRTYSQISKELFVSEKSVDNAVQRMRRKLKNKGVC